MQHETHLQSLIAALYVRGHRNQLDGDRNAVLASLNTVSSPNRLFTLRELQNRLAQWSLSDDSIRLHREATLLKSSISRAMNTSTDSLQEYTHRLSSSSLIVCSFPPSQPECHGHDVCFDVCSCIVRKVPSSYEERCRASSSGDVSAVLLVETDRGSHSTLPLECRFLLRG